MCLKSVYIFEILAIFFQTCVLSHVTLACPNMNKVHFLQMTHNDLSRPLYAGEVPEKGWISVEAIQETSEVFILAVIDCCFPQFVCYD